MSELDTLIAAHWQAKHALEQAKTAEEQARNALSNFLCKQDDGLKNKTMNLSGGWKLKQEIARTLRVNKKHEDYSKLPTLLNTDELNALVKKQEKLEFSYSAYISLPIEKRQELAKFITVNEAVAIKYEQKVDNR